MEFDAMGLMVADMKQLRPSSSLQRMTNDCVLFVSCASHRKQRIQLFMLSLPLCAFQTQMSLLNTSIQYIEC